MADLHPQACDEKQRWPFAASEDRNKFEGEEYDFMTAQRSPSAASEDRNTVAAIVAKNHIQTALAARSRRRSYHPHPGAGLAACGLPGS